MPAPATTAISITCSSQEYGSGVAASSSWSLSSGAPFSSSSSSSRARRPYRRLLHDEAQRLRRERWGEGIGVETRSGQRFRRRSKEEEEELVGTVDSDLWISRLMAAKRQYALQCAQHRHATTVSHNEDDPAWHTAETEDEDAGEGNNYGVAQECLDRLAIAIGGNAIVPIASELLPQYLSAPEWQKHHAALITLAQIAEGCAKVMLKNLEQVVSMILNGFQHPHPRVRWAAINAIGQLSTDLGPDLQVQYHQKVLPALANAMDDFQNPRVQAHAASAILNFSENCTPEILTPYLDGIVALFTSN